MPKSDTTPHSLTTFSNPELSPDISPLSLYVHFPWCVKKCPYCDFNSHTMQGLLPYEAYIKALIADFNQQLPDISGRIINTIFIGGGTPSLIPPAQIKQLLNALRNSGNLSQYAEISLEANPGAIDEAHFSGYLDAGVNRLSIGVQSFDDASLGELGRIHSGTLAFKAIERAQQAGFKRINLDLMFGLPNQSVAMAQSDIEQALDFAVEHISLYQLTIEEHTKFAHNKPNLPDSELIWQMQLQSQTRLANAGFIQYEVSAYSQNKLCQHNLNYWQFGDYVAIGAGAHGKLSYLDKNSNFHIRRYCNHRLPNTYLKAHQTGNYCAESKLVDPLSYDFEFLMNSLRLKKGFSLAQYSQRTWGDADMLLATLSPFCEQSWLEVLGDQVRATELGYRYLDSVLLQCLPNSENVDVLSSLR